MARNSERLEAISEQFAGWVSPLGISETPASQFLSDPDPSLDPVTQAVIAIFSEGQALANGPKSKFHLLDERYPHVAPHLPKEMIEDDLSEESWP